MFQTILLVCAAVLVGIDQLTKYLAVLHLQNQAAVVLIPGVFEFQYCENTGVAFSLLENQRWIFIPMTALVMGAVLIWLMSGRTRHYSLLNISLVLILAGGIANMIDRCIYGYVIDFLYFSLIDFPIFNFADCCVVIGAILLFVFFLFCYDEKKDGALFKVDCKMKCDK